MTEKACFNVIDIQAAAAVQILEYGLPSKWEQQVKVILKHNSECTVFPLGAKARHDFKIAGKVSLLIQIWTTGACMNTQHRKADYQGNEGEQWAVEVQRCKKKKKKKSSEGLHSLYVDLGGGKKTKNIDYKDI